MVFFTGDIHGSPWNIRKFCVKNKLTQFDVVVILGDVGANYFLDRRDDTMIFGHTPTDHYQLGHILRIWYGERLIGLDCGSGFPEGPDLWDHHQGRLACLRLDDMQEFYSSEDPPPAA